MIEAVKISIEQDEKEFTFNADELKYFVLEIKDMVVEGKEIDSGKAYRNAKYLAMVNKGIKDMRDGKGVTMTFEELERFINAQGNI